MVLFDFDGTLADSGVWMAEKLNELSAEFAFKRINHHERELLRGYDTRAIIKYLGIPIWKLPPLIARLRSMAARDAGQIELFAGVPQMLRDLEKGGIRAGIVSSNSETTIRLILGSSNAARISHYGCGASLFGKVSKLRAVLRRSGISARETIYIGDEIRDAVAARELGIAYGAVAWGYTTLEALVAQSPEAVFKRVEEIWPSLK